MIDDYLDGVTRALGTAADDRGGLVAGLRAHLEDAERRGELEPTLQALGSPEEVAAKIQGASAAHRHLDPVTLPDGTIVWAASFAAGDYHRAQTPDLGLYLDARWAPPWPHAHLDWPDFGVPADRAAVVAALADALGRARQGEVVELGCLGGHGRTGTALACLAALAGVDGDPVAWVRAAYCEQAVETEEQAELARSLARTGEAGEAREAGEASEARPGPGREGDG